MKAVSHAGSAPRDVATSPRATLADQVYETIKAQIHNFELVGGDRFSEADLGERLGVSRTPVREALFRLRNEGFLGVEPKLGWFVKPIDFDRIEQLYDLRVVIETECVSRLCARPSSVAELEPLKAFWLVPPSSRSDDAHTVGAHDERFHSVLVQAAGNAEMARVHRDVDERIRIVRRLDFTRSDRIEATYAEHAKVLRAIVQKKREQAQLLIRAHIEQSKSEVRRITLHALHASREQSAQARVAMRSRC